MGNKMNVQQIIETANNAMRSGTTSTLDELENYLIRAVSLENFKADGFGILSSCDFANIEQIAGSLFSAKTL
jgi:hypothetical protein